MKNSPFLIERLLIIGVGLIGGSLARALKGSNIVREVVGAGSSVRSLEQGLELKVIDRYSEDLSSVVDGADVIVIASPVDAMEAVFKKVAPFVNSNTIVTDVGSVKGSIVALARQELAGAFSRFVPGHPIAGTEKSGVANSFAELYRDRRVILTPTAETDSMALNKVRKMWQAVGAKVVEMSIEKHDQVLAAISHLPHVLAYALVDHLNSHKHKDDCFDLVAGGFYDITRIASSDPEMWRDICLANSTAITESLAGYIQELQTIISAINKNDDVFLAELFRRAKNARDGIVLERPDHKSR